MNTPSCTVYIFHSDNFSPSGNTVVSAALADQVIAVYGGGGAFGADGLSAAFGGAAIFKNEISGEHLFGVWGARNVSRFRRDVSAHMEITIDRQPPNARLIVWSTMKERPNR